MNIIKLNTVIFRRGLNSSDFSKLLKQTEGANVSQRSVNRIINGHVKELKPETVKSFDLVLGDSWRD